ncbi:glucokinase [Pseudooceanicola sp. C21-150M6]|uniref:glucokinase n=1 Tax=Pseudooceanicola sp. C21-150M6 TaxID=3434355 RepID=UPI003D7F3790
MTETWLVGDIGGTNARFALVRDGRIDTDSMLRLPNDDFAAFDDALNHYLSQAGPVSAIALSAAGPLTGTDIRMTNRDWTIAAATLRDRCNGGRVEVMNDLVALGRSVPDLSASDTTVLHKGVAQPGGQWVLLNFGTGFNVAPGCTSRAGPVVLSMEMGQSAIPLPVHACISAHAPDLAGDIETSEDLFSGRGLARLQARLGPAAPEVFARAMAEMTRTVTTAFMPMAGVSIYGGVARAVLDGPARQVFVETLARPYRPYDSLNGVPVQMVDADHAALVGCLASLKAPAA